MKLEDFNPLTPIVGVPTTDKIQLLRREIYKIAKSMRTVLHEPDGHLGVVMDNATYAARHNGAPYVIPVHPGPQAPLQGAYAAVAEANRVHQEAAETADRYHEAYEILGQLILAAVPYHYLSVLEDPDLGFEVSPQDILAYLVRKYATMTRDEAETNRMTLTAAIDINDPLEVPWTKITSVQRAALVVEPITDATAITLTLKVLKDTGVFDDGVKEWKNKPGVDQTMVNFRDHFDKADKERRLNLTVGAAGLHGANATSTVATVTNNGPRTNARDPGIHPTSGGKPMAYCYTHGASINVRHTSATCKSRCEGHQEAATMDNMMGGCAIIRDQSNNNRHNRRQQPSAQN